MALIKCTIGSTHHRWTPGPWRQSSCIKCKLKWTNLQITPPADTPLKVMMAAIYEEIVLKKKEPQVVIDEYRANKDSRTTQSIRDELRRWRDTEEATARELEALQIKLADIKEHITHLDAALHIVADIDRLAATEPIGFKEKRIVPRTIILTSAGTTE